MKNEETINLTVADLRRAHDSVSCSTAKQVIKALKPQAFEDEVEYLHGNIYASNCDGIIYKLHEIRGRWMFCCLDNSYSGWTGEHETVELALEHQKAIADIKVFSNQKDFINWCYEQTR